jgi:Tfp pilus assembly protein PilV
VKTMTAYDSTSFSAGQDTGTRVAACVARLAALELIDDSRWWNRWRRRLMARALVACAEEMECAANARDADCASISTSAPVRA